MHNAIMPQVPMTDASIVYRAQHSLGQRRDILFCTCVRTGNKPFYRFLPWARLLLELPLNDCGSPLIEYAYTSPHT